MWRQPVTWGYSGLLGNESNEQVKALSESVFWQKGRQTLVGFGSWCKIVTSWGWQFILQYLHGFYMFLLHARWLCGKSSGNVFCCSWGLGTDLECSIFAKHFCGEKTLQSEAISFKNEGLFWPFWLWQFFFQQCDDWISGACIVGILRKHQKAYSLCHRNPQEYGTKPNHFEWLMVLYGWPTFKRFTTRNTWNVWLVLESFLPWSPWSLTHTHTHHEWDMVRLWEIFSQEVKDY